MEQTTKEILYIGIIFLLLVGVTFLGYDKFKTSVKDKYLQQGFEVGYKQAVGEVIDLVLTCKQIPVSFENKTATLFAIECLPEQG